MFNLLREGDNQVNKMPFQRKYPEPKSGDRIGIRTVVGSAGKDKDGKRVWMVVCDCGTERVISEGEVRARQSCGCKRIETTIKAKTTHGDCKSKEFMAWAAMMTRCRNPKQACFKNYGGRGISVCTRWQKYEHFLADMGRKPSLRHTLERIDNDGNYEPKNCRWATRSEQALNKRNNRWISFGKETLTLTEWARKLGCSNAMISQRLDKGWSVEKTLTTPVGEGWRK